MRLSTVFVLVLLQLGLSAAESTVNGSRGASSPPTRSLRRAWEDTSPTNHDGVDHTTDPQHTHAVVSAHDPEEDVPHGDPHAHPPTDHVQDPPSTDDAHDPAFPDHTLQILQPLDNSASSSSTVSHLPEATTSKPEPTPTTSGDSSSSIHEEDLSMSVTAPSASENTTSGATGSNSSHASHKGIHFGPVVLGGIGVVCVGLAVYASKLRKAKADPIVKELVSPAELEEVGW